MPAYRLYISPEHDRLLETFPEAVRSELRTRIGNAVLLPVSASPEEAHEARVAVDGYSATLRLDAKANTVTVVEVSGP